ncbi:MAG TPA: NAD-dependent epimerase/dehydratase family protein [Mycobacteriales bacterium]|nr:NAD-dependent epimerase/dehydratase family protein [Mycobacteriales bacterium]
MRTIVLGGSGHIGSYLIPRLIEAGHTVTNITRGRSRPYHDHAAWNSVEQITADRTDPEFPDLVLRQEPDIVIDLICFTLDEARTMVETLAGRVQHFLHCGTIWIHGPSVTVPTTEATPRRPFGDYGVNKAKIEEYLLDQSRRHGFPATLLHPGHISGPGWVPINPAGNLNLDTYSALAEGRPVALPNLGLETLHHVHADDVAQSFMQAIHHRAGAIGESFHVVSPGAVTLRGYAETVAAWYGQKADLQFLGWEEWRRTVPENDARATWDHIAHSPNCSIDKARRMIDFQPRYSSFQTIREALERLAAEGRIPALNGAAA